MQPGGPHHNGEVLCGAGILPAIGLKRMQPGRLHHNEKSLVIHNLVVQASCLHFRGILSCLAFLRTMLYLTNDGRREMVSLGADLNPDTSGKAATRNREGARLRCNISIVGVRDYDQPNN